MTTQDPGQQASRILLGTVVGPHGIRGSIKIRPCTERPENISQYRLLYLTGEDASDASTWTNVQARVSGGSVIVTLKECTDRNRAEQLIGCSVWVPASDLPPIEADSVYLFTLMGKRARTTDGQVLGTVSELIHSAQDVLVIRGDDREYLVPAVRRFIVDVDDTEVLFDLPPGLTEINR